MTGTMDTHWIFMAWHPWVDWDSVCKSMDTHRISGTSLWDPVFRVDWGNLQPIGYPWHWHPWVDWDPGQSSPFKADWDSVGQCEWTGTMHTHWIFMALASLGRLGQRGILGQSSILDNLQGRLGQCGLGQDWDNGYPLDIHGIGIPG